MGIEYNAVVVVGIQKQDIEDWDKFEELIDTGDLEVASPYYDGSDSDFAAVGFVVYESDDYSSSELVWDQAVIDAKKAEFKKLTGQDAKVWLSPHGW